jgi:hypothetical protein
MTDEHKTEIRGWVADGALVVGFVLVVVCAWLIYRPAAPGIAGVLLLTLGVKGARG